MKRFVLLVLSALILASCSNDYVVKHSYWLVASGRIDAPQGTGWIGDVKLYKDLGEDGLRSDSYWIPLGYTGISFDDRYEYLLSVKEIWGEPDKDLADDQGLKKRSFSIISMTEKQSEVEMDQICWGCILW